MNARTFSCLMTIAVGLPLGARGADNILHDKSNACQLSLPAGWTVVSGTNWIGRAPDDQGDVQLISQPGKTVKPLSDMSQKALMVDKLISNTPQSVIYSNAPTKSDRPITPYRAAVPGKDGSCVAIFAARSGVTEETVKKIAGSMSATK